jgi:hypothetical protein
MRIVDQADELRLVIGATESGSLLEIVIAEPETVTETDAERADRILDNLDPGATLLTVQSSSVVSALPCATSKRATSNCARPSRTRVRLVDPVSDRHDSRCEQVGGTGEVRDQATAG